MTVLLGKYNAVGLTLSLTQALRTQIPLASGTSLALALRSAQRAMSLKHISFEVFRTPSSDDSEARIGQLSCLTRADIQTPCYFALSSRGAVPHLSQDTLRDQTAIKGIHTALEDCKFWVCRLHYISYRHLIFVLLLS